MKKKKILKYTLNLWVIFVAYILSPKDHSGWGFTIWFTLLTLCFWGIHQFWLRQFLNVHVLVLSAESLVEGDVYVALRFSEFSHNKAGYVVRLIPVWKGDVRYEEDKFYTERDYYVDGCGFDVLEQINGGNRPLVTLKGRILVRIV